MWRPGGRLPLVVDPVVTVVSWNLNVFTLGQRGHKAALLDLLDWDVGTASFLD